MKHTCNFNTLKLRQEDWFEFEISLDLIFGTKCKQWDLSKVEVFQQV